MLYVASPPKVAILFLMGIRSQELKKVVRAKSSVRYMINDEGEGGVIIAQQMHTNILKRSVISRLPLYASVRVCV